MTHTRHDITSRRGFSIVEVVIVVVIIGVTAVIAMPRYGNSIRRYRLESSAQRLISDFDRIVEDARRSRETRTLVIDVAADTWSVDDLVDLDGKGANYTMDISSDPYHADIIGADFDGTAKVVIDKFGRPAASGTVTLEVGGRKMTVKFNRSTGTAEVQP